ncbi:hypothetical protein AGLY_000639 [Aphis glycines]|uniref:Uncharacterized protein n=1 Tax=Aphis glycines TaxID=307491 RepID=A0A6G0UA38_APHGL|nr:hypothetical protein AGLY_000639 [Aphis glycines]
MRTPWRDSTTTSPVQATITTFTDAPFYPSPSLYHVQPGGTENHINTEITTQPIIDNNDSTPCEMQIFKAPDAISTGCDINKFPLVRNIYHRFLNKNTWIHEGDDTLTISCTDLPGPFVKEVKVSGAITIVDINCQVFTRDAVLNPIEDISSSNYKDFVPATKMQNIFNKIPDYIHKYKLSDVWNNTSNIQLTDLHSVSKSLDEIQQMIDEEVIREQSQKHQFIYSNLLYVSNHQVIDIPRRLANYRSQIRNVRRGNYASEINDEVPFSAPPSPQKKHINS